MKKYLSYLKDHLNKTYNPIFFIISFITLAVAIGLNYYFDFEDEFIDKGNYTSEIRMLYYFLLEGAAFLLACIYLGLFKKNWSWVRNSHFWLVFILAFSIQGIDRGFYYQIHLAQYIDPLAKYYVLKLVKLSSWLITTLLPMLVFYYLYDRKYQQGFYGIQKNEFRFRPYIIMYLGMIPLIFLASFTDQFLRIYPIYSNNFGAQFMIYSGWSEVLVKFVFELFYGFDFVSVELFFRGLLIFSFVRFFGKDVVYPMVFTYCVLHFGKPMGETISSILGGYILGVIALYSRNIWGGILIHAGIAVLMDIAAMFQSH